LEGEDRYFSRGMRIEWDYAGNLPLFRWTTSHFSPAVADGFIKFVLRGGDQII